MEEMKMDNKTRNTQCLNCKHSYRGEDRILHCHRGNTTMVTNYDCEQYEVFMKNKENLYEMYTIVKTVEDNNKKDVEEDKCIFGIDITTDTDISKGTIAMGYKLADGTIQIEKIITNIEIPEEDNFVLADKKQHHSGSLDPSNCRECYPEEDVKETFKLIKEDIHTLQPDRSHISKMAVDEIISNRAGNL